MSRWQYIPIEPGDPRDPDVVTAILDDLAASSTALDARNFAEEGLDAASFADRPMELASSISHTARTLVAPSAAYAQFNPGTVYRTGALPALGDNDAMRIRSWVFFSTTNGAGAGLPLGSTFGMRHAWNNGAVTAKVTASEVRRTPVVGGPTTMLHGAFFIESYLEGPIATIAWVELQYLLSGALNAFAARGMLQVHIDRNVEVA